MSEGGYNLNTICTEMKELADAIRALAAEVVEEGERHASESGPVAPQGVAQAREDYALLLTFHKALQEARDHPRVNCISWPAPPDLPDDPGF